MPRPDARPEFARWRAGPSPSPTKHRPLPGQRHDVPLRLPVWRVQAGRSSSQQEEVHHVIWAITYRTGERARSASCARWGRSVNRGLAADRPFGGHDGQALARDHLPPRLLRRGFWSRSRWGHIRSR